MPARYDLPNFVTALAFKPAVAVAANFNGATIDIIGIEGKILARADIGNATAGTNPTLDLAFKKSTDNSNWVTANVNYTQATATSVQVASIDPRALGDGYRYIRVDGTVGGTNSPSFPLSIVGIAQPQYDPA